MLKGNDLTPFHGDGTAEIPSEESLPQINFKISASLANGSTLNTEFFITLYKYEIVTQLSDSRALQLLV